MVFPFPMNRQPEPLDPTASETLERWCLQPEWDSRSLEEFAAEGGRPVGPPNRLVRESGWAEVPVDRLGNEILERLGRWFLRLFRSRDDRGRFYEMPPLPRHVPAPPPPSTPMITGYLRSSFPVDTGGALIFPLPRDMRPTLSMEPRREDRWATLNELPPLYPDDDERSTIVGGIR